MSFVRSLLKMLGAIVVAKGVADQSAVETISAGLVALAGVVWSHGTHATAPPGNTSKQPPAVPLLLLLGVVGIGALGCKTALQPGADAFVVRVEQTETIGYSTLDTFLKIDDSNRGFWRTNLPAMHHFAEYLRVPVTLDVTNSFPRWAGYIYSLDRVKLDYKAGRATSNEVVTVLATAETAVAQAQQFISQSAIH